MMQFRAEEWNDLGRNTACDGWQQAMRSHLGDRCKSSVETVILWQKEACTSVGEARFQPAAEWTRTVKPTIATIGLAGNRNEAGGSIRLLFDSFSQPRPAGTRSAAMRIRQMLYRVEPYQIDLHIELKPEQNRLVVTGQLVDLNHPEMVARDVQVMLSDGREFIVNTVTNQFGEFVGEVKNSGDLEISFLGRGGKPIVILLRGPLDALSGSSE